MVANIALLGFFKYWDFLITNLNHLGLNLLKPLGLGLPIGISFYTFQTMSYPIDLYRNETDPQKSLVSFGAYVCMFPQLIAGPIVRYTDIARQLEERSETLDEFYLGVRRFMSGLSKKVLLANSAGQVWESIAALPASQQSVVTAWTGILCYAFQIYFDFSGYSDMDDAMIAAIRKSGVRQILYVSCNPATLGRNLNDLASLYTVKKIQPYDLFPQTPHVETLTVLERRTR